MQGLSRFASDIIIRGFDTPAKVVLDSNAALGVRFENCNYAGIVTRMLQPILPIFFAVQFNFLYDGYKNEFGLDLNCDHVPSPHPSDKVTERRTEPQSAFVRRNRLSTL